MEPEDRRSELASTRETLPEGTDFIVPATVGRRVAELAFAAAMGVETLLWLSPSYHLTTHPWLVVPFFVLVGLHFLVRAFDPRPRLTIDASGIEDRTALILGPLRIGWEQVVEIKTSRMTGSVELAVREWREIANGAGPVRRLWMFLRRVMGTTTIPIETTFLGVKRHELESRLKAALDNFEHAQLVRAQRHAQELEDGRTGELESAGADDG